VKAGKHLLGRRPKTILQIAPAPVAQGESAAGDIDDLGRQLRREHGIWRSGRPLAGDGLLATFDGPARAIRCAQQIRDELRLVGLEIRSGLHAGEVTRRSESISGITVHIGARVSALAGPGEVLVTRTVRDLVAGSGISFEARGEHELKGVPGKWRLYAVLDG
jgi:class 3 adenylate cyclase